MERVKFAILTVVCRICRKKISRLEAIAYNGLCYDCYRRLRNK
jgi:hypothetical protein